MSHAHERAASTARGAARLAFDAVDGMTRVVEGMHANIAAASPPLGPGTSGRARGVSGFVYESIRLMGRGTGFGVDQALALLDELMITQPPLPQPHWDIALSALNGVLGDHLEARDNPLAIPMRLRRAGQPIEHARDADGRKLLILVHGLCMSDRQWHRDGHDHGEELARDLGYVPLYLHYNTGRSIPVNGRALAELLEAFLASSSGLYSEVSIVAHSMGGLVARSACHAADVAGHSWPEKLRRLVFLGTPHHGAPLERIGNWVDDVGGLSPYVAPLTGLTKIRSAGITDLRHGRVCGDLRAATDTDDAGDALPPFVALPPEVDCHAVGATLGKQGDRPALGFLGDGLVPLDSALGQHRDTDRSLDFAEENRWTGVGMTHFDLLSRPEVYNAIRHWFST